MASVARHLNRRLSGVPSLQRHEIQALHGLAAAVAVDEPCFSKGARTSPTTSSGYTAQ